MKDYKNRCYGRLTIIDVTKVGKRTYLSCICSCGNQKTIRADHVTSKKIQSCGCLQRETKNKTHGKSKTKEYNAWMHMKQRCLNKSNSDYQSYGGRGISVCDRWVNSFENFFSDMGICPFPDYSLDRIDVDGNYEPQNCKWSSPSEQARNKRCSVKLTIDGETKSIHDWAENVEISADTIKARVQKLGREPTDALNLGLYKKP